MKCINIVNIMSEHAGVSMTINVALKKKNQQFITTRNFKNLTWENLEPKIQEEKSLNDLFATQDPDKDIDEQKQHSILDFRSVCPSEISKRKYESYN